MERSIGRVMEGWPRQKGSPLLAFTLLGGLLTQPRDGAMGE